MEHTDFQLSRIIKTVIETSYWTSFQKQLASGEWMVAPILLAWPRGVVVGLSRGEGLAYGRSAAPCAYKNCAIYSDDAYRLPAVLFQQNFAFDPL
jgi:hypothetical protein